MNWILVVSSLSPHMHMHTHTNTHTHTHQNKWQRQSQSHEFLCSWVTIGSNGSMHTRLLSLLGLKPQIYTARSHQLESYTWQAVKLLSSATMENAAEADIGRIFYANVRCQCNLLPLTTRPLAGSCDTRTHAACQWAPSHWHIIILLVKNQYQWV